MRTAQRGTSSQTNKALAALARRQPRRAIPAAARTPGAARGAGHCDAAYYDGSLRVGSTPYEAGRTAAPRRHNGPVGPFHRLDEAGALCAATAHLDPPIRCAGPNAAGRSAVAEFVCKPPRCMERCAAARGGADTSRCCAMLAWMVERLDDPALGTARRRRLVSEEGGRRDLRLHLGSEAGDTLLTGRAVIAWPRNP